MGSFFLIEDQPHRGGILLTRTSSSAADPGKMLWLETDPTGTPEPLPSILSQIDTTGIVSKLAWFKPYK